MKNKLILSIVLGYTLAGVCAFVPALNAADAKPSRPAGPELAQRAVVKIGVILPLTGNSAHLGERFQKTIRLFEQESRATKNKYEIIVEDDEGTNRNTMLAAQRLISLNHVNALVTWAAGAGNTVAAYAQEKGVIHFNISLDPKVSKGIYNFMHWVNPYSEAAMMQKLLEKKNAKNVVIIGTRQQAIMLLASLTEENCAKAGIKTQTLLFNPGERDFRTPLTPLRFNKPDYIVLMAFSPEMEIILRQLHEVGVDAPITNMGTFDFISDRSWIEGRPYISAAAASADWSARFEKLSGVPPSFAEPYMYDILKIITDAYEHTPTVNNLQAANWIMKLKDYPTEVGVITPDSEGIFFSDSSYYVTRNKQRTPITFEEIR